MPMPVQDDKFKANTGLVVNHQTNSNTQNNNQSQNKFNGVKPDPKLAVKPDITNNNNTNNNNNIKREIPPPTNMQSSNNSNSAIKLNALPPNQPVQQQLQQQQTPQLNNPSIITNKNEPIKPVVNQQPPQGSQQQQQQSQSQPPNKNQSQNSNNSNNSNVNNKNQQNQQGNKPNNNNNNNNSNNNLSGSNNALNKNNPNSQSSGNVHQQNQRNQNQQQGNRNQKFNQNKNDKQPNKYHHQSQNGSDSSVASKFDKQSSDNNNKQQSENVVKKFTGRCRLFVGNLPSDLGEQEFRELFSKYGDIGECFLNTQRSFGFIKLDTRINAEQAKHELDGFSFKGRSIRVRFASHGAAVRVKNLSPYISNEYLEQAFSMFGPVERAVVIVDDKGRPTGEGIVEFERKPAATQCINKCSENCFILTSYPKPVVVEPLEQKDDEDGLPEKSIMKNNQYHTEREQGPHFAPNNSFEHKLALKWRELYELEKRAHEEAKKQVDQSKEMLEYEIEQALIDHKTMKLKEDLRAKQEELQRIEDMRKTEYQRRQEMELRRQEDERRRQEEMMIMRKQQESMMMHSQSGQRGNQNSQGQYDPNLMNQSHQGGLSSGNGGNIQSGGNRRGGGGGGGGSGNGGGGGGNNNNGSAGLGAFDQAQAQAAAQLASYPHNQAIQQLPPAQQQALIAAQLSFAMAAAAQGNLNIPNGMFDNPPNMNNNNNNNNSSSSKSGGNKDDHRSSNSGGGGGGGNSSSNNNSRRNFDRRGGRGGGGRDDSYPYDSKRARF